MLQLNIQWRLRKTEFRLSWKEKKAYGESAKA